MAELTAAWNDFQTLRRRLEAAWQSLPCPTAAPRDLRALHTLLEHACGPLLTDILEDYLRRKPVLRGLLAVEEYDASLHDAARQLPDLVETSSRVIAEALGPEAAAASGAAGNRLRGFRLRNAALTHLAREQQRRATLDGAAQRVLARCAIELIEPWQNYRHYVLSGIACDRFDAAAPQQEWADWQKRMTEAEQQATRVLRRYHRWTRESLPRLAAALLRGRQDSPAHLAERRRARDSNMAFWQRQQRAVIQILTLELGLAAFEREIEQEIGRRLDQLGRDYNQLLEELDGIIAWLERWSPETPLSELPSPTLRFLPAQEQAAEWTRWFEQRAERWLPAHLEVVDPGPQRPGLLAPWRDLRPRDLLRRALERSQLAQFYAREAGALDEVHGAILRDVERTRQVVGYALDAAAVNGESRQTILQEAVANALALLRYQRRTAPDLLPRMASATADHCAQFLIDFHLSLQRDRLGSLANLTRRRGRRAARELDYLVRHNIRRSATWIAAQVEATGRRALQALGLVPLAPVIPSAVRRRPQLDASATPQTIPSHLPVIYRSLFERSAVQDSRFLVGREEELQGLADAYARWMERGFAAVLIVGARGSGKTSLLNCAAAGVLKDAAVVRNQFRERITAASELHAFLRRVLGLDEDADVETALRTGRRVLILEELERAFLRRIGGFEAIRELLRLIYPTSASTLWILSVNESAFRLLAKAVGMAEHFSHRLNSTTARPEAIQAAILQRHNLSGLRLEFAAPPQVDRRLIRIRRALGIREQARDVFFDSLYLQSQGIFRSAFEIWLDCIEAAEGGVLRLRQPQASEYRALLGELTQGDTFALQAILQHGSLTADDLAAVLLDSVANSRQRLQRLTALGLLEPDPGLDGLRVTPEAIRPVREKLQLVNLL